MDHPPLLGRQAIVDRHRKVVGYELFNGTAGATGNSDLLLTTLTHDGTDTLAGRKTVFVGASEAALTGDQLDWVRPDGVVLAIPPIPGAHQPAIDARAQQLQRIAGKGFRLAFSPSVLVSAYGEWLPMASYIALDVRKLPADLLIPVVQKIRQQQPKAELIAQHVSSADEYKRLTELGVSLFQGDWLSHPVTVKARMIRPAQATVIQLMNLLRRDAELSEIEELLKRDPSLSFNLLRFINSSGFGLSCEVTSFRHAAMILGQKNLFRWAAMLLTASRPDGAPPVVGNTAIVRGRLTELLAAELLAPEDCDNAFVVGVFSLLDEMLGVPATEALHQLPLPQPVLDALLHRSGPLAPFLELAMACERGEDEQVTRAAGELQLSNHQINVAHLTALAWADSLEG